MTSKEEIKIICDTEDLYETCENMEQLFDYYLTLNIDYQKIKQENKQLKEENKKLKMIIYGLDNNDLFPTEICELIKKINDEVDWNEYLQFQERK